MPPKTTLMQAHGLARGPVRKPIDTLEEEGRACAAKSEASSWSGSYLRPTVP